MSLFDWAAIGLDQSDASWAQDIMTQFRGSFAVTIGDAVSGFYGSRHTHIMGPDIRVVFDPEGLIQGAFPALNTGFLGQLVSGVQGNTTFTYGPFLSAIYGGPKMDIRRAKVTINKQADSLFGGVGNDAVDTSIGVAIIALSALLLATIIGLELALHFKYKDLKDQADSQDKTALLLKDLVFTLSSRIMGLIKVLEARGTLAELAAKNGVAVTAITGAIGRAATGIGNSVVALCMRISAAWAARRGEQGVEEVAEQ